MDLQTILGKLFANAGAVGIEGVFQFVFGPHQAYWSEVKASSRTEAGRHASPDVTIEVAEKDFLGIMGGMANVEELFASGRLKIGGNMGLATMLPQIIDHARHGGGVVEKVDMNKRYPTPPRFSEKISASLPTQYFGGAPATQRAVGIGIRDSLFASRHSSGDQRCLARLAPVQAQP
ncbi:putative sterol carrier protein [Pseudomonas sp. GM102]|nr:putative sterol carrier protein [Pseudomonas sp. GM102]